MISLYSYICRIYNLDFKSPMWCSWYCFSRKAWWKFGTSLSLCRDWFQTEVLLPFWTGETFQMLLMPEVRRFSDLLSCTISSSSLPNAGVGSNNLPGIHLLLCFKASALPSLEVMLAARPWHWFIRTKRGILHSKRWRKKS